MTPASTIAPNLYSAARSATAPTPQADAASRLGDAARGFAETLHHGETTAKAAMVGDADAHALVEALAATELAVETAVTVRDKVVEAYQEILRMPV
ncbi:flagellar hook-basal body complex protein FliE [Rhodovulum sp. YNF3179]|uniref:flagellar hook-basal body complex protein FliE n=1 Tax=Rhodovulum sp. YNF3179 TaxID=3425127 RepID=UPI003D3501CC